MGVVLTALSDLRRGETAWKTAVVLERRFRGQLFRRERLRFDTRFSPPAKRMRGVCTLYLVGAGSVSIDGAPPAAGPLGYLLAENERENRRADAPWLAAWGDAWQGFELHLHQDDVRAPIGLAHGPLPLPPAVWTHLDAALRALDDAVADPTDVAAELLALLEALTAAGVLGPELVASMVETEGPQVTRVWAGIQKLYAAHQPSASLRDLQVATGLSLTQLGRDLFKLTRTFGLFGQGWREALRILRLRSAVLWLSSPELTATDVAGIVGYQSTEAMARGFRDAGLPAPTQVGAQVRLVGS